MSAFVGKWQLCTSLPGVPNDVVGIEFDQPDGSDGLDGDFVDDAGFFEADGHLEYLGQGASGPVPGQGFAYVSGYSLEGQGSNFGLYLGGAGTAFLYSPCPPQLELQVFYDAGPGLTADILLLPF